MNIEEMLQRRLAMFRLISQAERLEGYLRRLWLAEGDPERRCELERLYRRAIDRTSRREDAYRRWCDRLPAVTTVQVAGWVRQRISQCGIIVPDPAELAGEACSHFGLWDEHDSIPQWVHGICERTAPKAQAEVMHRRALFVEKPVHYEPDGDVLWK